MASKTYPAQVLVWKDDSGDCYFYDSLEDLIESKDVESGEEVAVYELKEKKILRVVNSATLEDLPLVAPTVRKKK